MKRHIRKRSRRPLILAAAVALATTVWAQNEPEPYKPVDTQYRPATSDYKPAAPAIRAGSAVGDKPAAGSLSAGKPAAGSLTLGRPTAGSLGGSIQAGSIAPSVGVPLNTITAPTTSIGVPMTPENLSRSRRTMPNDDNSSRTRRSSRIIRRGNP